MQAGKTLRWRIIAAGFLLVSAFIGSAAYDGWRLYRQIVAANERELGNLAKALSEEASRSLQAVDLLLRDTATWYQANGSTQDARAISAGLTARTVDVSQVSLLTIVDAQGMQRYRSRSTGEPLADVSDRPYFQIQREKPVAGLFINEPIVTRSERVPALVLSRRIDDRNGRFDGVVTAIVTLQQLQAAYNAIQLGDGSALMLTLEDGTLVVRQPGTEPVENKLRFPEIVALKGGRVVDRFLSPVDGRSKLVASIAVARQPLLLAITRDEEESLRPWYDEMRSASIRTLLLSMLVLLSIVGLLRQLARAEQGERALRRSEARLQQAQRLEALGTLAGGIAHDFNNILGAILGFGEMAQQRAEPGTPIRRHIDRVMQSGARARLLVKRILDFSRSGVAERVPLNLGQVIEEVIAMLAPSLPPGMKWRADLNTADAAVIGDATQVHQVAMNLCTNAVQAMGGTGLIEIRLNRVQLHQPRSFLHGELPAGAMACLEVIDIGPGIAPEVLARMFDPFFTTKKVGEGTGLGLSVVHGIVSDMGGAIDVRRHEPQGTAVSVWLPISGELARSIAPQAAHWPVGHGEVVMIVDDERAMVELTEEWLAGLDYEAVGFDSSADALRAFAADPRRFDAVISDQRLPGLQGIELARQLLVIRPGVPIILMSGNLSEAEERLARAAGVRATLRKPLALGELAVRLAALLEKPR